MIAAIGAFDGFHKGHQALLETAKNTASVVDGAWGVVTFSRSPGSLFARKGAGFLFTNAEQVALENFFEIPEVHRIDFTRGIANMSPDTFLDYIAREYGANGIVVGADFKFGKDRSGDVGFLEGSCRARGWPLDVVPIQTVDDVPVCSTTVRNAVTAGDMGYARRLLGYPYFCASRVIHGNERGRSLGFPTANIELPSDKVAIRSGVYAAVVRADGGWHIGAANIGSNPTFGDVCGTRFEVNLVDYSGDLYGAEITVFLTERIRDEERFDSADDLSRQIKADTEKIVRICEGDLRDNRPFWQKFEAAL